MHAEAHLQQQRPGKRDAGASEVQGSCAASEELFRAVRTSLLVGVRHVCR